jgi:hypothetical protein
MPVKGMDIIANQLATVFKKGAWTSPGLITPAQPFSNGNAIIDKPEKAAA